MTVEDCQEEREGRGILFHDKGILVSLVGVVGAVTLLGNAGKSGNDELKTALLDILLQARANGQNKCEGKLDIGGHKTQ